MDFGLLVRVRSVENLIFESVCWPGIIHYQKCNDSGFIVNLLKV